MIDVANPIAVEEQRSSRQVPRQLPLRQFQVRRDADVDKPSPADSSTQQPRPCQFRQHFLLQRALRAQMIEDTALERIQTSIDQPRTAGFGPGRKCRDPLALDRDKAEP